MKVFKLVVKANTYSLEPYLWKGWYEDRLLFKDFCYKTFVVELDEE